MKQNALNWWDSLTYSEKNKYRSYLDKYTSMDSPVDPVLFPDEEIIFQIYQDFILNKK